MTNFRGFKTKKEAEDFIKINGFGLLCYEKTIRKSAENTQNTIRTVLFLEDCRDNIRMRCSGTAEILCEISSPHG